MMKMIDILENRWKLPQTYNLVEEKYQDKIDKIKNEFGKTPIEKEDIENLIKKKETYIEKLKELLLKNEITIDEFSDIEFYEYEPDFDDELVTIEFLKKYKEDDDERKKELIDHMKFLDKLIEENKEITLDDLRKRWVEEEKKLYEHNKISF